MRRGSLLLILLLAGCPGGGAAVGDPCGATSDCSDPLQCVAGTCQPKCQRAPDCGDGYACSADGYCVVASGQAGDACSSEVDCAAGLACRLDGTPADDGHLLASCAAENSGAPAGAICVRDNDCRDGTCALGHCADLCSTTRDCAAGESCAQIPRVEVGGTMFGGCLQAHGSMSWPLVIDSPTEDILLPIPDLARSVSVTFSVDDLNQKVGALQVLPPAPDSTVLFDLAGDLYSSPVRHQPDFGQAVLDMPSSPDTPLVPGAYRVRVSSLRPPFAAFSPGTATPSATAVIKLDQSVLLDLHFYFLDLDDHPCSAAFGGVLDAAIAQSATFFQEDFVGQLRQLFADGGVTLGTLTYEDLRTHPELDGLDDTNAAALLALGAHDVGINVFFVRTLSPSGLQAFGPNPGPAGLAGTAQSGIIVGLDTLCYRSWPQLARLSSHELARYMGLYDNVELDPTQVDPIADSDTSSANLMFYSELGGGDLSAGQQYILARSAVLR